MKMMENSGEGEVLNPTFPSSQSCSKGIYPLEEYYEFFNDYAAAGAS